MTVTSKRTFATLVVLASLTLGACGSSTAPSSPASASPVATATAAPTATATPTPTPSPSPTASPAPTVTPAPTPDANQGAAVFKFAPSDVLAYFKSVGFKCTAQDTSIAGYVIQQCLKTTKGAPTAMISLAWSTPDGVTQYGYAGYYNKDGAKKPDSKAAITHLGTFIGALLGQDDGTVVVKWVASNFGSKATETYKGLEVYSYPLDAKPGSGYFFEITTPEFQKAIGG